MPRSCNLDKRNNLKHSFHSLNLKLTDIRGFIQPSIDGLQDEIILSNLLIGQAASSLPSERVEAQQQGLDTCQDWMVGARGGKCRVGSSR